MEKEKFFFINRVNYFDVEFLEFSPDLIGEKSAKCVQLYVNNNPVIIAGKDLFHRDLMKLFLENKNLKFDTRLNPSKDTVPLEEGENYRIVGAGRLLSGGDKLIFYDSSSDYIAKFSHGANKKHLEDLFGEHSVVEDKSKETGHGELTLYVNL